VYDTTPVETAVTPVTPEVLKSEMVHQLRLMGEATAAAWEQTVFKALTGRRREDLDWSYAENVSGYELWIATFTQLVAELIRDGSVVREVRDGRGILFAQPEQGWLN
jgi:hypothetical protein